MEITYCTVTLYVSCPFPVFLERLCHAVAMRWKSYQLLIGDDWYQQRKGQISLPADVMCDELGVFFCRNKKMDRWWETHGFQPMANGEGPFGVAFSNAKDVVLKLRPPSAWLPRKPDYAFTNFGGGAILAVPELLAFDLMLPGIPGKCEFSTWVAQCAVACALRDPTDTSPKKPRRKVR